MPAIQTSPLPASRGHWQVRQTSADFQTIAEAIEVCRAFMDYHKNEEKLQDIAVCDMRGVHRNVVVPK
ncbi:MAG: hypothetical protein II750_01690 [Bacteroidaceae bacterium]|nr:hypothetical protein [Bacteroidaceae bacterium]